MKRQDKNPFSTPSKWRRIIARPNDDSDSSDSSFEDVYRQQASFGQDLPTVHNRSCFCGSIICECPRSNIPSSFNRENENGDNPSTSSGVRHNQTQDVAHEQRSNARREYEAGTNGFSVPLLANPVSNEVSETSAVSFVGSSFVRTYPPILRTRDIKQDVLFSRLRSLREWVASLNQQEQNHSSSANNIARASNATPTPVDEDQSLEVLGGSSIGSQLPSSNASAEGTRSEEDYKRLYEELHSGLVNLLECPVCMELITPPIQQCRRGHLICTTCKLQLQNCPSCRDRFLENRNLAMERVADKIRYPCKNAASGCSTKVLLATKEDHEANCEYRTYACLFRTCGWTGFHQDLHSHVREVHPRRIKEGEKHVIEVLLNNPTSFFSDWAVFSYGQAFRVNIFENIPNSMLYASVVYMGPRRKAADYTYTITLKGNEGREISYKRRTHAHSDSNRLTSCYASGDCFVIKGQMAQHFLVDGKICLEIAISCTMPG